MRTTHTLAVALIASAALAAPAAAMPTDPPHGPGQPPVVVQAGSANTSPGFDWDSAGIGAAGGVGAFAIALAAAGGMRRRRPARPGHVVTH